jgi:NAD(P)-dependent dehydrogenase (short-subunit alcohol dehydrogenase family)
MAGTGVTVNSVLPGPRLSEGVAAMLRQSGDGSSKPLEQLGADFVREQRPSSILQRPTTVEEVANMVVYVASPLASGTTGAALAYSADRRSDHEGRTADRRGNSGNRSIRETRH